MQSLNSLPVTTVPIALFYDDEQDCRTSQIRWNRDEYYKMAELGFIYSERTVIGEKQSVSPLAKPKAKIKVAEILP